MSHTTIGGETPAPTGSAPRSESRTDVIRRLTQRLETERPRLDKFDNYYSGTQPIAFLAPEVRAATSNRLSNLVVNWPRLVVRAVEERLNVSGFRLGKDQPADTALWDMWQANNLDEGAQQAHQESLIHGRAYALVWAGINRDTPRITIESAKQVIVEHAVGSRQRVRALKRFVDDGYAFATLYEPFEITRWRSVGRAPDAGDASYVPAGGWALQETIPNPLGVVPVVPLVNEARLMNLDGDSELADIVPLADGINKLAVDLMTSAEYSAMPRRWVTGLEIQEVADPVSGEKVPVEPFSSTAGRTWQAEGEETKFGQFPEATLTGFIDAMQHFTREIAALASLPPHYVALSFDQPASADAIRSAEASLVSKARRKMVSFAGSWEEVMRLAVQVRDGIVRPEMQSLETIWRDPETRTTAQAADAAAKLVQAGIIPVQQAWDDLGYSPMQQERMRKMRRQDALDAVVVDPEKLLP